jgi:hypothetical protein
MKSVPPFCKTSFKMAPQITIFILSVAFFADLNLNFLRMVENAQKFK